MVRLVVVVENLGNKINIIFSRNLFCKKLQNIIYNFQIIKKLII